MDDTLNNLTAGTYQLNFNDSQGCSDTLSVTISEPDSMMLNATGTHVSCNGGNDGTAMVTVAGGVSPHTFSWTPGGATTPQVNNLMAGTHTVTVTDSTGCAQNTSVTINDKR